MRIGEEKAIKGKIAGSIIETNEYPQTPAVPKRYPTAPGKR